jgi:hypothetical protein
MRRIDAPSRGARVLARHFGKQIAGHPAVVVSNMPS